MILTKNNVETQIARSYHNENQHEMDSIQQLIMLNQGDTIQIKLSNSYVYGSSSYITSNFMGYLVYSHQQLQ